MGESGLGDQLSEKLLQPVPTPAAAEEKETDAVTRTESHSDNAGEVGGNGKRLCVSSMDEEDRRLVSDFKNMKIEAPIMNGDGEMEKVHDEVDDFIKRCFGEGNYKELLDQLKDGKGVWADHLRAVVRAKIAKRKRGESENAKDLCTFPGLAYERLTYTEISKLRCYFYDHMQRNRRVEQWSRVAKTNGVYGAYLRALFRSRKTATFYDRLIEMKKEGVSLEYLAVVVTEISCSEIIQQSSGKLS